MLSCKVKIMILKFIFKLRFITVVFASFILQGMNLDQYLIDHQLVNVVKSCQFQKIEELIRQGADIDAKDYNGDTTLMYATMLGYKDIVKMLISAGADVNIKNIYSNTALIYSATLWL